MTEKHEIKKEQINFLKDEIRKANFFRAVQTVFCILCFVAVLISTSKFEMFFILLCISITGFNCGILTEDIDNKKIELEDLENS